MTTRKPTANACRCGAPCRFVLCDACYALPLEGDYADVAQLPAARAEGEIPDVGLPVAVDGVHRFW